MSWTKRQFVEEAFAEIGYATYTFDLQPEQLDKALRRLDGMMGTWNALGIRVGYPIPSSPENSDLDEETNVPDAANEAIYTNLGIRIAPIVGKTASAETKANAKTAYDALLVRAVKPVEWQMPANFPAGAGHKGWRNDDPFLDAPTDPIEAGGDGPLEFT